MNAARRSAAALAVAGLLGTVAAGTATGAAKPPPVDTGRLWATINVCDTAKSADTVGIRASMPGSGVARERMYLRFQVQFFKPSTKRWLPFGSNGDSGFKALGKATRNREAGVDFTLSAPAAGQSYRVRGLVSYQWRRGKKVVRRASRTTSAGHPGTVNADPKGYTAAECTISSPPPGTTTTP